MYKFVLFIASFLFLFALVQIKAEVEDDFDLRQERGLFKLNSSWFIAYKNFTATKLLKQTALITSLLNSTTFPFKTKKIALLNTWTNNTVKYIIPKFNTTGLKILNKAEKLQNSTLSFFNTSSILLNSLLNAKLQYKNNSFLAKLQLFNASGIALVTALNAKANQTNTKLSYLFNTTYTSPWGLKLKKNYSAFWSDELADQLAEMYNLTNLESELLVAKLNQTFLKSNGDIDENSYDDTYDDTYSDNYKIQDNDEYQIGYEFEYE